MIVVYGGTSSGKSSVAEDLAVRLAEKENRSLYYLATMESQTSAAQRRIEHHKSMRQGKGFDTIEEMKALSNHCSRVADGVVLLECLSNLVANYMFDGNSSELPSDDDMQDLEEAMMNQILALDKVCRLIVVTNNVFGAGKSQDQWCDAYMKLLGSLNQRLAKQSDIFLEVNLELVTVIKGDLNWLY